MCAKLKLYSQSFELEIEKLVYGGFGLGRYLGQVVFVPFSLPGDRVLVRPVKSNKKFMQAEIKAILQAGPGRKDPSCCHFGSCGGCHWQHLAYGLQVENKRRILEEIFTHRFPYTRELRIGMKSSPREYGYRTRARVQARGCGPNAGVGFYRFQSHLVEEIDNCPLLNPCLNNALKEIRRLRLLDAAENDATEFEIMCSDTEPGWGVSERIVGMGDRSSSEFMRGAEERLDTKLKTRVSEFEYSVMPGVFFQANGSILPDLLSFVRTLAKGRGSRAALDLYCGVGLFTLPLAQQFERVVAVESSAPACRLCEENASTAGLRNIELKCADAVQWVNGVGSVCPPGFDLVVLDPPRTGAGKDVMNHLKEWGPENIIYVSCDPQTLCRDLAVLPQKDYRIDFIQGFDLFPQTYHFETVVRIRRQ
jgi:23S rRNA (uracil1939-C5)-methyltransferase